MKNNQVKSYFSERRGQTRMNGSRAMAVKPEHGVARNSRLLNDAHHYNCSSIDYLFHNLATGNDLMDLLIFHPTAFHRLASTKPFPDSKSLVDLVLKPHLKPEAVLKRVEALGPVRQDTAEERVSARPLAPAIRVTFRTALSRPLPTFIAH